MTLSSIATADPVMNNRLQWIDQQMSTPPISDNCVSGFTTTQNAATGGVDVAFTLTDSTGVASITLVRSQVSDISQGVVLQTWSASDSNFAWSDTDSALQTAGQAYYFLKLEPLNTNGSEVDIGPQYIQLNTSGLAPLPCTDVSASHAAAANGAIMLTVNVAGITSGNFVKIYVSGYQGNASFVAFAQHNSAPLQFPLVDTGETVTIEAIQVSLSGVEAASGPACTLTLNSSATAAAKIEGIVVTQIFSGNQIAWPSSLDSGVTGYQIYRGNFGGGFGAATLLTTVSATGQSSVQYLDAAGLAGNYEYYLIAVSTNGNSPASASAYPTITLTKVVAGTNITINPSIGTGIVTINANNFTDNETVSGSGTSWTLANAPSGVPIVMVDTGTALTPLLKGSAAAYGYSISGANITTVTSYTAGKLIAWYRH